MKSCIMIITDANDFVRDVHDRMPVILEGEQFDSWLNWRSRILNCLDPVWSKYWSGASPVTHAIS